MPGFVLMSLDKDCVHEKYLCPHCEQVLRDPVQTTDCGHRYCWTCFEEILRSDNSACDVDGTELRVERVFSDKCVTREILGMIVRCVFFVHGCLWNGELRNLEGHSQVCEHAHIKCIHPECGADLKRSEIAQHLETECVCRGAPCQYCAQSIMVNNMQEHHGVCPKYPVQCPDCQENMIPRNELLQHRESECEEAEVECSFQEVGCKENKKMKRKVKKEHEKSSVTAHLSHVMFSILKMKEEIVSLMNELSCSKNTQQNRQDLINKLFLQDEKLSHDLNSINQTISSNTKRLIALETTNKTPASHSSAANGITSSGRNGIKTDQVLAEFFKEFKTSQERLGSQDVFNEELRLDSQDLHHKLEFLERELDKHKQIIQRQERKLDSQDHLLNLRNITIADLSEKIQEIEVASYEGILIWKIPNITRKKHEAITGKKTSFYSPPFFTSRHGYKMCARIYLNGDGMGKGSHVSVFIVLMRGEYDAILQWPFNQKVIIMMLDQNGKNHAVDSFIPESSSSSFKRPTTEMNIATGCPMFLPLSDIDKHAYVRDDVMFIKMIVG